MGGERRVIICLERKIKRIVGAVFTHQNQNVNGRGFFEIAKVFPKLHGCQCLVLSWSVFKCKESDRRWRALHIWVLPWFGIYQRGFCPLLPPSFFCICSPPDPLRSFCPVFLPLPFWGLQNFLSTFSASL